MTEARKSTNVPAAQGASQARPARPGPSRAQGKRRPSAPHGPSQPAPLLPPRSGGRVMQLLQAAAQRRPGPVPVPVPVTQKPVGAAAYAGAAFDRAPAAESFPRPSFLTGDAAVPVQARRSVPVAELFTGARAPGGAGPVPHEDTKLRSLTKDLQALLKLPRS